MSQSEYDKLISEYNNINIKAIILTEKYIYMCRKSLQSFQQWC